jgi:Undecaprenyl-phosphate glucose phosphotransferase
MKHEARRQPADPVAMRQSPRIPISATILSGIAVASDSLAILASGFILLFSMERIGAASEALSIAIICTVWVAVIVLFLISDLYRFEALTRPFRHLDRIFISFATAFLFLLAAAFAYKMSATISRLWMAAFAVSSFGTTMLMRASIAEVVRGFSGGRYFGRNVVIVGAEPNVSRILARLQKTAPSVAHVAGLFVRDGQGAVIDGLPVMGEIGEVENYVRNYRVDDVVIALPWSSEAEIHELVSDLRNLPVNVYLGSDLVGLSLDFAAPPSHYNRAPMFSIHGSPMAGWSVAIKAIEDYVIAGLLTILCLPLFALIALAIKLDSPGPVFFRQDRLGFNNRRFKIRKFRSMYYQDVPEQVTIQARKGDPRITRVGRFLRKSSLDELPQLLNVLDGNMSIVGPRPHAVDHNEEYSRQIRGYFARHRVKPGITGWAQVNGLRGETDTPEKMEARVRYDVYYTENWSLFFDIRIILQTFIVLVTGRNAH